MTILKGFQVAGQAPKGEPDERIQYVTEGESRGATHPELERRRVY